MTLFGRTSPGAAEAERAHRRRWILIPGVVVLLCVVVGLVTVLGPGRTHEAAVDQYIPAGITRIEVENPGEIMLAGSRTGQARAMWQTHWNYRKPTVRGVRDGDTMKLRLDCSTSVGVECFADVRLDVPKGVAVDVDSAGGDVMATGLASAVTVNSKGGDIEMNDVAGDVKVHNLSGDVTLHDISGALTAETRSGDVHAEGLTGRTAHLNAVSGDVEAEFAVQPGHVTAGTRSGEVTVRVPRGTGPYQVRTDVRSGDVNSEVASSPTATPVIDASTRSGDIRIAYSDGEDRHDRRHEPPEPREPPEPPKPPQPGN